MTKFPLLHSFCILMAHTMGKNLFSCEKRREKQTRSTSYKESCEVDGTQKLCFVFLARQLTNRIFFPYFITINTNFLLDVQKSTKLHIFMYLLMYDHPFHEVNVRNLFLVAQFNNKNSTSSVDLSEKSISTWQPSCSPRNGVDTKFNSTFKFTHTHFVADFVNIFYFLFKCFHM